jgi:hypothetical protein
VGIKREGGRDGESEWEVEVGVKRGGKGGERERDMGGRESNRGR